MSMQTPLQITAHDVALSEAAEKEIRKKAAKLETFHPRLLSCHIVVGAPVRSAEEKVLSGISSTCI